MSPTACTPHRPDPLTARFIRRLGPRRLGWSLDLIRGLPRGAKRCPSSSTRPSAAARLLEKVLRSAVANAEHNHQVRSLDDLRVAGHGGRRPPAQADPAAGHGPSFSYPSPDQSSHRDAGPRGDRGDPAGRPGSLRRLGPAGSCRPDAGPSDEEGSAWGRRPTRSASGWAPPGPGARGGSPPRDVRRPPPRGRQDPPLHQGGQLFHAGIARIEIERAAKRVKINIHTARPGIIIGRKGTEVDKLKAELEAMTKKQVFVNIIEIRRGARCPARGGKCRLAA